MSATTKAPLSDAKRRLLQQYLSGQSSSASSATEPAIPRRTSGNVARQSFFQEQVWIHSQIQAERPAYNEVITLHRRGPLDVPVLERCLDEIVRRHEIWRTTFEHRDGQPMQVIHGHGPGVHLPVSDLRALPPDQRLATSRRMATEDAEALFDLGRLPLWRARLIRMDEEHYQLHMTLHQIIMDGATVFRNFMSELVPLYRAFLQGEPSPLQEPKRQYADFAEWQRMRLGDAELAGDLAYWRRKLGGTLPVLEWPNERPRPPVQTFRGATETLLIPAELIEPLKALADRESASLFMALTAGFVALLHRYTGQEDLILGTPAGNRSAETEGMFGYFINMLPLRFDLAGDPSFRELLRQARTVVAEALSHSGIPFVRLLRELDLPKDTSRNPLFHVMLTLEPTIPPLDPGWDLTQSEISCGAAKLDLDLSLESRKDGVAAPLLYNPDLMSAASMHRMFHHWTTLLRGAIEDPDRPISRLPVLTPAERQQLLVTWNETQRPFPSECLPQLFEAQVQRSPDATAVVFDGQTTTYGELNRRANQLAHFLIARGITAESTVALCVDRSADLLVALMAVLKSGAAYVPMDPQFPEARLAMVMEDARCPLVVTQQAYREKFRHSEAHLVLCDAIPNPWDSGPESNPPPVAHGRNLAYVIFTSGSTGRPKGVEIEHRSLVNLLVAMGGEIGFTPTDTLLAVTTISFDIAGLELFLPLIHGATIVLAGSADILEGRNLSTLITRHRVTVMQATPTAWRLLIQSGWPGNPDLRALTGGEALPPNLAQQLARLTGAIWNVYGPTETTIWSSIHRVSGNEERSVPIGRPIANTQCYILDAHQQPVPTGCPGELYIGGDGVARGYFGRPDLTSERFVALPTVTRNDHPLFRTGDQVQFLESGEIEFLGRLDQQIKLRGYRIELGDIEAALAQNPAVGAAIALVREEAGDTELVAFVVPREGRSPSIVELRDGLTERLPAYMVPSRFVLLSSLPLTPNGKVDRKSLANRKEPGVEVPRTVDGPRNDTERELVELWKSLLRRPAVGIHDNFFALGGHSLLAIQVLSRIRAAWSSNVPMRVLFDFPTIAGLAAQRPSQTRASTSDLPPLLPAARTGPVPLSPAQERLWFLDRLERDSTAYLMAQVIHLSGPLNIPALERALREIVSRHDGLRTVFQETGSGAVQAVAPVPAEILSIEDLSGLDEQARRTILEARSAEATQRGFDLTTGPLFRFRLLCLGSGEHRFLMVFHHIVADGWSLDIFNRELAANYDAFAAGQPAPLAPLPVQYADFSAWQRQFLDGDRLQRLLDYWIPRLSGAPPLLDLPTDGSRARSGRAHSAVRIHPLPAPIAAGVEHLCQAAGVTPFMVLLAAFKALLTRLSGQEDLVIGTPIAGRTHLATEPLIGFFVSTIALRTDLSGSPTFRQLLDRVRNTVLEAQEHQDLPFEKLIEQLHPDRTARHHPVFQVLFNLVNFENDLPPFKGLTVQREQPPEPDAKFDLTLYVRSQPGRLEFKATYPSALFQESTIRRLLEQLQQLLAIVVCSPDTQIHSPSLVLTSDRPCLPDASLPLAAVPQCALHEAFVTQARRTPQRLALSDPERRWTYAELERDSNRLANHLIRSGLLSGDVVAVHSGPSGYLAVAILGILKAGGIFLVLDTAQPEARRRRMVERASPVAVIGVGASDAMDPVVRDLAARPGLRCLVTLPSGLPPDADTRAPARTVRGSDAAYIVFTSGSTGEPLGILGDHGPVSHFLTWHLDRFQLSESDRYSQLSGLGHDPLLRDLFAPLSSGASVHIPPAEVRQSYERMQEWFHREGITVSHLTPALAQIVSGPDVTAGPRLDQLRWAFIGGDRLSGATVHALRQRAPVAGVVNFYGTTETPQAMAYHVAAIPGERGCINAPTDEPVPLGHPINDAQLILMTDSGQLAGIGELAEITIRTPHLSRHYLDETDLTRSRYVTNPVTRDETDRLYRTGDLGRYRADGSVSYVGRRDHQIKVRGYRVEPDEIIRALKLHSAIRDCAVTARTGSGPDVIVRAHVVLRDPKQPPDRSELRGHLKEFLPEPMIPAEFLAVDSLPLTPNGKVDRRALDKLPIVELATRRTAVEPRTEGERKMLEVWRDTLGRDTAGIHDNFFEIGGHSLLALRLVTALHRDLQLPVTLADLFAHPTVAGLATALEPGTPSETPPPSVFRGTGTGAPWFHIPGVFGLEFLPRSIADAVGRQTRYYDGLQYPGVDGRSDPATTVPEIAAALVRQIQILWPGGPIRLSGYSMGGLVAFETARQLADSGRSVDHVVLFDTRLLYNARRKSTVEQGRILLRRFREQPADRRWGWVRELVQHKLSRKVRQLVLRMGAGPRDLQERMEIAGWAASAAHRPRPYAGRVTLLRSTRMGELDSGAWERDPWNGWSPFLHPGFEVRHIDCDHERTFLEPVSPDVLAVIGELLKPSASAGGTG